MKIFEREETPDLIKVTISCSDRRIKKETFDIVDSDIERVYDLFMRKSKTIDMPASITKSTINLREYSKKSLGRSKNITVKGMEPITLSLIFKTLIKSLENE